MTFFIYLLALNTVCGDTFLSLELKVNLEIQRKDLKLLCLVLNRVFENKMLKVKGCR